MNFPMRIVLIDDNIRVGRLLSHLLKRTAATNSEFHSFTTLDDAKLHLEDTPADLVLLDNHLSSFDRFEQPLLQLRDIVSCPIVLISGSNLSDLGYDKLPDGLAGYLSKSELSVETLEALFGSLN